MKKPLLVHLISHIRAIFMVFAPVVMLLITYQQASSQQFTAYISAVNNTSKPYSDPAYINDGSLSVTVVDGPECTSVRYNIGVTPIPGSGPGSTIPPQPYISGVVGGLAGTFNFINLGVGTYEASIYQTSGSCTPAENPIRFLVTIYDGLITCPEAIVEDVCECPAVITYDPYVTVAPVTLTYSFEFDGSVIGSGTGTGSGNAFPCGGTTLVTLTAENSNGVESCTFAITVNGDTEGPVVVNAGELDATYECKGEIPDPNPDVLVLDDNCSNSFSVTWAPDIITNGDCLHNYTLQRIYTIGDNNGNSTIFTQTFTVDDQTPPALVGTLPGEDLGNACLSEMPEPPAVDAIAGLYEDNCSGLVSGTLVDTESNGTDCAWAVTYTYKVSDICGNTVTPVIVYTGGDTEAPGLISETLTAASLDEDDLNWCLEVAEAFDPWGLATDVAALYEDNCTETPTVTAVVTTPGEGNTDCAWTFMYAFRIEDPCGNAVTPTVTYSGGDTEAPVGTNTATLAMVDACYDEAEAAAPFSAEVAVMGYTDNCGQVTATYTSHVLTGDDCDWTITYTFSVWDECDNELPAQTYAVSGYNTVPPSLTGTPYAGEHDVNACFEIARYEAPFDAAMAVTGYEAHCPGGTVTAVLTLTEQTGDDCAWVITYTFTVEDGCGLGLESQTYTNSGGNMEPPVAVFPCPEDQDVLVDEGACVFTVPDTSWDAVFVDYCMTRPPRDRDPLKITIDILTATYTLSGATTGTGTSLESVTFNLGETEVVWAAEDDCGNQASCTFTVTVSPRSLNGIISYYKYDAPDLPLEGVMVRLMKAETPDKVLPGIITYTFTDNTGFYSFNDPDDLEDAEWIEISTNIPHGGLSSGDALAVSLRVANNDPSYWGPAGPPVDYVKFLDHVGDVNATLGTLNTTDAFYLFRRHVGLENEFDAGDWAFYATNDETILTNTSANTAYRMYDMSYCEMDISVRTFGDVRGTYSPGALKSLIPVQSDEVMNVMEGETFELPVTVDQALTFNAVSFYLDYASDKLEVLEVKSDIPGLTTMIEHGTIRVEWYDLASQSLSAGEAFITLVARTIGEVKPADVLFKLGSATEFVDATAQTIPDVDVSVSSLNAVNTVTDITDPDQLNASLDAYPNPFRHELTLRYAIPEAGMVKISVVNLLGSEVATLVNHQHEAGAFTHAFRPDAVSMEYGVYFVRFQVVGESIQTSRIVKIIYNK